MTPGSHHAKRGYRIMYLYCVQCECERTFSEIDTWRSPQIKIVRTVGGRARIRRSANPTPNIPRGARLIRAICMYCRTGAMYVSTAAALGRSRCGLDFLCACGLPWDHEEPHLPSASALVGPGAEALERST